MDRERKLSLACRMGDLQRGVRDNLPAKRVFPHVPSYVLSQAVQGARFGRNFEGVFWACRKKASKVSTRYFSRARKP